MEGAGDMNANRIQVKFFLENAEKLDFAPVAGIFQRWIQQHSLEGLLIDVADYRHVPGGPGVVLIGHDSDYSLDRRDGKPGLLYTRKRDHSADLLSQLRTAMRLSITACRLLEGEKAFHPNLKFRADTLEFRFPDRLNFPNRVETLDLVKAPLSSALAEFYGPAQVSFTLVDGDPREVFTVVANAPGVKGISSLTPRAEKGGVPSQG